MDPSSGAAMQVLWPNGNPTVKPDPNKVPNAPGIVKENRSQQVGAFFIFNPSQGHNHWHFQKAAYYALLLPGGAVRSADKVGFCMWDSWVMDGGSSTKYFPVAYKGSGPTTWCAPKNPRATFTRMGISRNYGDLYAAQSTDQWVDIKGLKPGSYQIRATANPSGYIDESNPNNNTVTVTRTIPGTIAGRGQQERRARRGDDVPDHRPGDRSRCAGPEQPRRGPGRLPGRSQGSRLLPVHLCERPADVLDRHQAHAWQPDHRQPVRHHRQRASTRRRPASRAPTRSRSPWSTSASCRACPPRSPSTWRSRPGGFAAAIPDSRLP